MGHRAVRTPSLSDGRIQTVYFAFGSNLHLGQMAKRCPESRYLGRGLLLHHKWQINTRGYANIYDSPGNSVHGLCFLLSQKDEERLDRNEGVNMIPSAYDKEFMDVEVYPTNPTIAGRRVKEVNNVINDPLFKLLSGFESGEKVRALVYVNRNETGHGPPKTEYISRILSGSEDAKLLGVPPLYFEQNVALPMGWEGTESDGVSRRESIEGQRHGGPSETIEVRSSGTERESRMHNSDAEAGRRPRSPRIVDISHPPEVRVQSNLNPEVAVADAMHHRRLEDDIIEGATMDRQLGSERTPHQEITDLPGCGIKQPHPGMP
ncbi:hypothetical protein VTL71DRAFT_13280 [Oculimacula yallundae]|uniref:gamma-glutamylcyclotransferase n=1 Tax=Oculimacula yallundae TaxID=86028 RepID=A0ABR4CJV6_9HELO